MCHYVSVLDIDGADVWFPGGPQVLHRVDLRVEAGEHWALLGANGAGKSTLLALAGAQRFPSRGTVEVLGPAARPGRRPGAAALHRVWSTSGCGCRPSCPSSGTSRPGRRQTVQPTRPAGRGDPGAGTSADGAARPVRARRPADRRSAPKASGPGPGWPGRWCRGRRCCCSTSRPAGLDLPGRADFLAAVETAAGDDPALASVTVAHHLEELPAVTSHVALLRDGRITASGDVSLLRDAAALSACFGRPVRSLDVDGRWFATALPV